MFLKFTFLCWRSFSTGLRRFSVSFQYFLNRVLALKGPLIATEQNAYNSVFSVESITGMTSNEAKTGQHRRRPKCATHLGYRRSKKIMIYIQ